MPEKQRRYFLKGKESRAFLNTASEKLTINLEQILGGKVDIEVAETEFVQVLIANGEPILVKDGERVYPALTFKELIGPSPKVVVDMGAVPFVCKGANVMAPGIRRFEGEFKKGNFVFVVDEKHGKPIAVGETIYSMEDAKSVKQGIIVKNLHFVGDRTWNFLKELASAV